MAFTVEGVRNYLENLADAAENKLDDEEWDRQEIAESLVSGLQKLISAIDEEK